MDGTWHRASVFGTNDAINPRHRNRHVVLNFVALTDGWLEAECTEILQCRLYAVYLDSLEARTKRDVIYWVCCETVRD